MIEKSFNELIDQLSASTTSSHLVPTIAIQLSESGGTCQWCDKKIKRKHKSWEWRFSGLVLRMHLKCFLDWFSRIVPDAEKADSLTGGERGK